MSKLDKLDIAILERLQDDARLPAHVLAADIGLSHSAIQRRIKRLRDDKVITSEVAVIDPAVAGDRVTVIVQVVLDPGGPRAIETFKRAMLAADEVQHCYYVAGTFDFVVIINARSMAEYERFTQRVFFPNDNIHKFHTTVIMETVKTGLKVPL